MQRTLLQVCAVCAFICSSNILGATIFPFQNVSLSWEVRRDDLVKRLTIAEITRESTYYGYGESTAIGNPGIQRLGIKPYAYRDCCLHGLRYSNSTTFPQALGNAASFSKELMYNISEAISYELRAQHNSSPVMVNGTKKYYGLSCFSPVINIARHPLWGRNQETYGEDPFLSGSLVQEYVRGLQGEHPRYIRANAGCKHFDVHGGPEDIPVSRLSFNAKVSMRDWRMTFLPAFKMCVEAGTYSLMCSYNRLNDIPACANVQLLTDIARNEWGFSGYVVSDSGAIDYIKTCHKYTKTDLDTAVVAIRAGCNLELNTQYYLHQPEAIQKGNLTEKQVRDNIKPLFYTRLRLGEFDPEQMNPYNKINMSYVQSPTHRTLAQRAAQMSFVLLKNNDGFLPLKTLKREKIAVVGPMADNLQQLFGDYSSDIISAFTSTPRQGLSKLAHKTYYTAGCTGKKLTQCLDYDETQLAGIQGSELVFVCLGTGTDVETEGRDRADIALPGKQLQVLEKAVHYAGGKPVVLLLFNAGPVDITYGKMSESVVAIMECFFPAQSAGYAIYNVLTMTGPNSVPAARLPMTWPASMDQVPPMVDYSMEGRTYRYYKGEPLYPFGYGLSYSKFTYSNLVVEPRVINKGEDVFVHFTVTSLGPYDADEVVQLYIAWGNASVPVPKLQLVAFDRISVMRNTRMFLSFKVSAEQMRVWLSDSEGWGTLPGTMYIYAGGQQPDQKTQVPSNILRSSFTVR